jgi:predicted O-methyltransferase YrrM
MWDKIFDSFGSDKCHHNYGETYRYLLEPRQNLPITLLEIGVLNGASLRAWEEIFPKAKIIGVDNNPETLKYASNRSKVEIIDQNIKEQLIELKKYAPFDVIIDDGSHMPDSIEITYEILWPMLKIGGIYAIEDTSVKNLEIYSKPCGSTFDIVQRRLERECITCGVNDRLTIFAGELIIFVKRY